MNHVTMVKDLEPRQLAMLRRRIERVFLMAEHESYRDGFHGDGVAFRRGTLYYHPMSAVDTVTHEACHVMLLPAADRSAWEAPSIETSEDLVMPMQVELARGIPGLGVAWALRQLEEIDYSFGWCRGGEVECTSARCWWRRMRKGEFPRPWIEAA